MKNIRISGLMEMTNENSEQTQHKVRKHISEILQLHNVNMSSVFRIGKRLYDFLRCDFSLWDSSL